MAFDYRMKVLGLTLLTALVCGTYCLTWDDLKNFIEEETAMVTKRELVIWDDGKSTPMVCPDGKGRLSKIEAWFIHNFLG